MAILFVYAVAAMIELEAMKQQNNQDEKAGRPLTYDPLSFWNAHANLESLIKEYR